ncbi:FGGY-family carbohydrate kinase, partial [Thermobifida halotolerans]|uniref:FGGY-family carbohydrate kinase n=1 Tax=Thermobifida halotolerans TaxID=483545 RepID=UPI0022771963
AAPAAPYRTDLLTLAFGRELRIPRVADPAEAVGEVRAPELPSIGVVAAGTGDNMAAALALDARPGDVVVSIGTSGTAFAVAEKPTADPTGAVAGFADATGRFLPLVCTLNAARVLSAGAAALGVDLAEFDRLALAAPPGADGLVLLPYLDGERTPDLPEATGRLDGLTRANLRPENVARAFVEGMLCGLADAVDALVDQGVPVRRVLLVGGGARSAAVRALAPRVLGRPVTVPAEGEYVADGAARQAAWALSGTAEPPAWENASTAVSEADPTPQVRERYAAARDRL